MKDNELTTMVETDMVSLRSAELEAGATPTRILIAPWGDVESTRGQFFVDGQAVAATIEQFREHGTDIPIDFEHQTLGGSYASPDGLAPAAGWIKALIGVESVGLMADVEWTELGLEHLQKRQYRYLSPVALIRKSDRRLVGLHSAALTNKPAIVGMEALVNREDAAIVERTSPGSTARLTQPWHTMAPIARTHQIKQYKSRRLKPAAPWTKRWRKNRWWKHWRNCASSWLWINGTGLDKCSWLLLSASRNSNSARRQKEPRRACLRPWRRAS